MIENEKLVFSGSRSNNSRESLVKSKKVKNHKNLFKFRKLKNHSKLSNKTILDKYKIWINMTIAINASAMKYVIAKTKVAFTLLKQAFIKIPSL